MTVREARSRKQPAREAKLASDAQRTLTTGKRFLSELENLTGHNEALSVERYEELLELFQKFVSFVEREAAKR